MCPLFICHPFPTLFVQQSNPIFSYFLNTDRFFTVQCSVISLIKKFCSIAHTFQLNILIDFTISTSMVKSLFLLLLRIWFFVRTCRTDSYVPSCDSLCLLHKKFTTRNNQTALLTIILYY